VKREIRKFKRIVKEIKEKRGEKWRGEGNRGMGEKMQK